MVKMSRYYFTFSGRERERFEVECKSVDEARNEAVRYLGQYLAEHPGFADEGHWRVNVEDSDGLELLHVIVATVAARAAR
ncbi:MAG: hypothetical protein EOO77_46545 [Oxalobacteraceae bacterium]|nr:MAG: hypothetical protein EOO77_46545 [Oxalobacteraceae bacterium]